MYSLQNKYIYNHVKLKLWNYDGSFNIGRIIIDIYE